MKQVKVLFLVCLVAVLGISAFAYAEVPKMINYQGKITTSVGLLIDTTVSMVFTIYSDTGIAGVNLWSETQDSVKVEKGVFSVLLGSINPIPDSVFNGSVIYLGLKAASDPEMTPRKAMVSVGYAYHSGTADTAYFTMPDADWTIDGDNIYHSNGNVGIGITNPISKLHVANIPDWDGIRLQSAVNFGGPGQSLGIIFRNADNADRGAIRIETEGSQSTSLTFYTSRPNIYGGIPMEKMRITSEGAVGIGTTTPTAGKLHIESHSGSAAVYGRETAGGWGGYFSGYSGLYVTGNGGHSAILMGGNVGIGTTSPQYNLDVEGYVQASGYLTGDIVFQKDKEKLWRMYEDEDGLYLENLKTGKIYRFVLQEVEKK
jgi:hypothetical protein